MYAWSLSLLAGDRAVHRGGSGLVPKENTVLRFDDMDGASVALAACSGRSSQSEMARVGRSGRSQLKVGTDLALNAL